MPKYVNSSNRFVGKGFLKIPIGATDFYSEYYYQDDDIVSMVDVAPQYNPVKFRHTTDFTSDTTVNLEFPYNILSDDNHLVIYTKCNLINVFDAIEITFNDPTNLPAMPLTNSQFEIQIHNRIKRLQIITKYGSMGQIVVMVVDRFVPSQTTTNYPPHPVHT